MTNIKVLFLCFFFLSFKSVAQTIEADSTIYSESKVDVKAEFKDGNSEMFRFLGKNIKYPKEARTAKVEGMCYIKFVVDEKGNIDKTTVKMMGFQSSQSKERKMLNTIELLNTEEKLLVFESIRVICLMPKWKPANIKGQNVKVFTTLPIKFSLGMNKK
jgi:periplasmic protein TonB